MGVDIQQCRAAIGSFIQKGYISNNKFGRHQNFKSRSNRILFNIIKAEGELARKSFKYRSTRQWNQLPLNVRNAETLKEFKNQLKTWVLENVEIK